MPTELNEAEMKKLGMKISAKDIFNPNKPSIKDAAVQWRLYQRGNITKGTASDQSPLWI